MILGSNLFVGGDLNFTLNHSEICGPSAIPYPLSKYLNNELERTSLIDIWTSGGQANMDEQSS